LRAIIKRETRNITNTRDRIVTVTGRCHCGAIRYTAGGAAEHHALCHCTDCRPWSGAPMVGSIAFHDDEAR
jgi:hypothetical protein